MDQETNSAVSACAGRVVGDAGTIWMSECKPQGYEVIDIRLGGVKSRLKSAARRIETWLSHPEKQLEELEEQRVCFWPDEDRIYSFNRWEQIVSASNINEL